MQSERMTMLEKKKQSVFKRKKNNTELNGEKETNKECVDQIRHTHVSFMDFLFQCLDW